jgi:hypothetical protein
MLSALGGIGQNRNGLPGEWRAQAGALSGNSDNSNNPQRGTDPLRGV